MIDSYLKEYQLNQQKDFFRNAETKTIVDEITLKGYKITRYINEFWTSGQRQGHSLHEISYRGCFKSELPRFFISKLSKPGDLVYDPFMGRGTTLLEAALLNRQVAGNDINPLSIILIEPRLNPPEIIDVANRLKSISWNSQYEADLDLSMFFSPRTENKIVALRKYLEKKKAEGFEDYIDKWIRMVATNRLTGHSPGFFSVYTLPPNQAVSPDAQQKINKKRNQVPPDRNIISIIERKSQTLQKDLTLDQIRILQTINSTAKYFYKDSQKQIDLRDESVHLIVTSPPFLDTIQYSEDNWMRCWFNSIDVEDVNKNLTITRTVVGWTKVMRKVFLELIRILKPKGWIAFEVGEVRRGSIFLDEVIAPIGIDLGLKCQGIVINQQSFTKTGNCWGIKNNEIGTNTNRIVLFQKD